MENLDITILEDRIRHLMENNLAADIYFHKFGFSQLIKNEVEILATLAGLPPVEAKYLMTAALFLNTGYTKTYEEANKNGYRIAATILAGMDLPEGEIEKVIHLMKMVLEKKAPQDLQEKLLYDATYAYYGLKKFRTREARLHKEMKIHHKDTPLSEVEWERESLTKLKKHGFFSQVAEERYEARKNVNINKTKSRIEKEEKKEAKKIDKFSIAGNKAAQVIFKTSLRNHIDLTSIADQKSNIMLSVNALLITIGMPIFASYLSDKMYLLVPSIIFMLTCISTMIFATLSTRPIKMKGETNLDKINTGKTNLFFFGNFYRIDLETYQQAIKKVIANKERLDLSIINDLYFLGNSLGDKFRYLRICYNVFMGGMILSLLSFLIAYFLFGKV